MKIVIVNTHDEFCLSRQAIIELGKRGVPSDEFGVVSRVPHVELERNDPHLVEVVELLGSHVGDRENLKIVEIPDDVKDWYITDYDGKETIREGRYWE